MELVDKCLEAAFQFSHLGNDGEVSKTESFILKTDKWICLCKGEGDPNAGVVGPTGTGLTL